MSRPSSSGRNSSTVSSSGRSSRNGGMIPPVAAASPSLASSARLRSATSRAPSSASSSSSLSHGSYGVGSVMVPVAADASEGGITPLMRQQMEQLERDQWEMETKLRILRRRKDEAMARVADVEQDNTELKALRRSDHAALQHDLNRIATEYGTNDTTVPATRAAIKAMLAPNDDDDYDDDDDDDNDANEDDGLDQLDDDELERQLAAAEVEYADMLTQMDDATIHQQYDDNDDDRDAHVEYKEPPVIMESPAVMAAPKKSKKKKRSTTSTTAPSTSSSSIHHSHTHMHAPAVSSSSSASSNRVRGGSSSVTSTSTAAELASRSSVPLRLKTPKARTSRVPNMNSGNDSHPL